MEANGAAQQIRPIFVWTIWQIALIYIRDLTNDGGKYVILRCYPMRLQYWQRTEVTGLFTEAYMGMAPAFGYFGMATCGSCRCPELSMCL
jgi:hypothetical protein